MKKVVKFGGSSLASASQFEKVGAIIREDESRKYVVPFCSRENGFPAIQRLPTYYTPAIAAWEMRKNSRRS